MKLTIVNDPLVDLFEVIHGLWPEISAEIQYVPDMDMSECVGCTTFPEDSGIPLISISSELPVIHVTEIIAHEVAHVVAGIEAEHGPEWEKSFKLIHEKYNEFMARKVGEQCDTESSAKEEAGSPGNG